MSVVLHGNRIASGVPLLFYLDFHVTCMSANQIFGKLFHPGFKFKTLVPTVHVVVDESRTQTYS